ncbi:MAG: hypothetical protein ACXAB2_10465 [Candidatus Hodarchaeales archaeon]|jgi:predicted  nucleic acid-binding Zn-ribbon protein
MGLFKSNNKEEEPFLPMRQIEDLNNTIQKNSERIREIKAEWERLNGVYELLTTKQQDGELELQAKLETIQKQINNVDEKVEQNIQGTKERVEKFLNQKSFSHFGEDFNRQETESQNIELTNKVETSLKLLEESMKTTIEQINQEQEKNQNKIKSLADALDMLGNGVEELYNQIHNQKVKTENPEESNPQFKDLVQEITVEMKNNQESIFENYTQMLNSYTEDFHEELSHIIDKLQQSHNQVLNEVLEKYMSNNMGNELRKKIDDASKEFRFEIEKIQFKIANDRYYQNELLKFRQEMQVMVDRKINEKFTAISHLYATVTAKTEELSLLLKTPDTQISSTSHPVETESSNSFSTHQESRE